MIDVPTLATLGPRAAPVPCRARVVRGADAGQEREISPPGITVGTDPGCELRLSDAKVSRRHLALRAVAQGFEIRDLGSTNGTFVDGNVITAAVVRPGTDIAVGDAVVRLLPAETPLLVDPIEGDQLGDLVAASLVMRELCGLIDRVADTASSVLVEGETGTGKDLVARTLHGQSSRARQPLVVVDCGSIPESLIESELFGHARGAFTGAVDEREGAFQRAHGGTIFLDEVGELPLALQPRFLRVLESGEVRPVGSDRVRRVDVRLVAATHRDLAELVERGAFRADLYFRLAVVCLRIPPLRARAREDIPRLVGHLLRGLGVSDAGPIDGPNLQKLLSYAWPGNVRELRNVIERAVALSARGQSVTFAELPLSLGRLGAERLAVAVDYSVPYAEARQRVLAEFERGYLRGLLEGCAGNVSQAAKVSGLSRKSLYEMMKRHGIGR